jgi:tRNA-dihydrouridine synthase
MNGQWGARRWSDLVGCVLADKYLLVKNLEAVRGSCGCPFICEDLQNSGTQVFIKLLDGAEYTLNREVAEVDYMVDIQLRHNNLVEMLEVIKNATVVKRSGVNLKVRCPPRRILAASPGRCVLRHVLRGVGQLRH